MSKERLKVGDAVFGCITVETSVYETHDDLTDELDSDWTLDFAAGSIFTGTIVSLNPDLIVNGVMTGVCYDWNADETSEKVKAGYMIILDEELVREEGD